MFNWIVKHVEPPEVIPTQCDNVKGIRHSSTLKKGSNTTAATKLSLENDSKIITRYVL